MNHHAPTPKRPRALLQLLVGTGVLAVLSGLALVVRSDGRWLRLPIELLDHTPFGSYLIPGLVLAGVVGGVQLWAGRSVWRLQPGHLSHAAIAAAILGGWIAAQALMVGPVWLQLPFFVIAIVELMLVGAAVPRADGHSRKGARAARKGR